MKMNGLLYPVALMGLIIAGSQTGVVSAAENSSAGEYAKTAQRAFRSGDYKTSAGLWAKAVKLDPSNPDLRDGLGKAYEREAESASFPLFLTMKARQNFVRALQLQPDHAGAMADLIELNQQPVGLCEGDLRESSELIDRLSTVDPDAAKREREYWKDASQDASRAGQIAMCAPVKLSRVVAAHFVPPTKIPAAPASKTDSVVADAGKPAATPDATIAAGLN